MKIVKKNKVVKQNNVKKSSLKKNLINTALFMGMGFAAIAIKEGIVTPEPLNENDSMLKKVVLSGAEIAPTPTPMVTQIIKTKEELMLEKVKQENEKLRRELSTRGIGDRFWYDYSKLTCPADIVKIIKANVDEFTKDDELGVSKEFFDVVYCIIAYESNFNPRQDTKTPEEHSIGLLQVNTWSNYPKNADKNKLKDPNFNLKYQLPELYSYFKKGKQQGLKGIDLACYVSRYGQRPKWTSTSVRNYIVNTITRYDKELKKALK
jgi:hypothetical protein